MRLVCKGLPGLARAQKLQNRSNDYVIECKDTFHSVKNVNSEWSCTVNFESSNFSIRLIVNTKIAAEKFSKL